MTPRQDGRLGAYTPFPDGKVLAGMPTECDVSLPYFGSQIELRSQNEVWYMGTLYAMDPTDASVYLRDVTCSEMGEVAVPFVMFRRDELLDLRVVELKGAPDAGAPMQAAAEALAAALVANGGESAHVGRVHAVCDAEAAAVGEGEGVQQRGR